MLVCGSHIVVFFLISVFASGLTKRGTTTHESADNEEGYVETTPGSSAPIST